MPLMSGLDTMYLRQVIAMVHSLVSQGIRALTSAILFFTLNLIGLGLGPTLLGMTSDLLKPQFGSESLRYAMLIAFLGYAWSAAHYFRAAKYLKADLDKATMELSDDDRKASIVSKFARWSGFARR